MLPRSLALTVAATLLALALADPARADLGDCTQPITTGDSPAASDCLFILKSAVGSANCDPQCVCDPNKTLDVTATDALLCLRGAVGQPVSLLCQCYSCGFILNSSFAYPVTPTLHNGWTFDNITSGGYHATGGNLGGYFTLNDAGQAGTDPMIWQIVSGLVPGKVYEISGDYRSFAPAFGNANKADAFVVAVTPQPFSHPSIYVAGFARPSPTPTAWKTFSVTFTASGSSAKISFFAERDGDDSSFDVDNLCLAPAM